MTIALDLQPTLIGKLVALRPLRAEDHDALYAVARDPLVWEQHPAKERATPEGFRQFFEESLASGGALLASDAETGEVIGSSRYFGYDAAQREVEIGWSFLARSRWGGRYNGEMKGLMLEHAFRSVDRVLFIIAADNWRSRRAVEKIGGVYAGPHGEERVVYEIRREGGKAGRREDGKI
ncbi:MAG TPA: GNAT family N-acetyltransferase [Gemmatimonadales bacterium]|nr:GNAT family N-acetyltransferase [Gemmatimonadales bacterium]